MNLSAIRPSFSQLSEHQQEELITRIRFHRRTNAEAKQKRAVRAAKTPRASRGEKLTTNIVTNMTPEQAAQLLAMLGETDDQT